MDCTPAGVAALGAALPPLAVTGGVVYDGRQSAMPRHRRPAVRGLGLVMGEDARRAANRNELAPSDDALLVDVRRGNEGALRSLYERYADLVYTVALRIVGDRDLAQEVLQDVFLRCWERADTFRPERGRLGGWLTGIARNRAVDLLRSSQHQARLREQGPWALDGAGDRFGQVDPLDQLALRQAVRTALEALSPVQRQTIELAFYGGLTQAEIAQATATPLGTVKTRIRGGMLRLRALLQPVLDQQDEAVGSTIDAPGDLHG